jgi:predicted transcriptional regulator
MTVAYLMNVDEASSHEIEVSTGLRQPEVSLAMKVMHKQSWVDVRLERKLGKGRPIKIYSLVTPISAIMDHYENAIRENQQASIMVIEKARTMSSRYPLRRN